MTSTCGGMEGLSFGFVNDEYITAGSPNRHFNNYGGEERLWLSPEGGQFSLWFEPGEPQNLDNWFTPPAFNEGAWKVVSDCHDAVRMATTMKLQNTSGTHFHLDVSARRPPAGQLRSEADARRVGGEEDRRSGREERGLRDRQPLDQSRRRHDPRERPRFRLDPGHDEFRTADGGDRALQAGQRGRVGSGGQVRLLRRRAAPSGCGRSPEAVLLRADGNYRSKIGISQRRARNVLGSIDFQNNVLTLVHFSMPADPTQELYMNNQWGGPSAEPYKGDVANSYNDGPPAPGKKGLGPFYEIESLSPAKALEDRRVALASAPHHSHPGRSGHAGRPGQGSAGRGVGEGEERNASGSDESRVTRMLYGICRSSSFRIRHSLFPSTHASNTRTCFQFALFSSMNFRCRGAC